MKRNSIWGEAGFWSSVFMVLMVSLGTMALSAYYMMNKETESTVNSTVAMQVDYSANGAAYWGIGAIRTGVLTDGQTQIVTVSGMDVAVSATQTVNNTWQLDVASASEKGLSRNIQIELSIPRSIANLAIGAEGTVDDDIIPLDVDGNVDPDLIQEGVILPDRDAGELDGLFDMVVEELDANDIRHGYTHTPGDITAWGDTVAADPFYYRHNGQLLPFVVYVNDDPVKFYANYDYHGIFLVDGNVRIQSGHTEIYGVIMQLDPSDTVTEEDLTLYGTTGERPKFYGGVYSYGSVHANGHPSVQHNPEYTNIFAQYLNQDLENRVLSWEYVAGDDEYDPQY